MNTKVNIILSFEGREYNLVENWGENYGWDSAFEGIRYMFEEGNYSCDCNRSILIRRQVDSKFKEMDCGKLIKLVAIFN